MGTNNKKVQGNKKKHHRQLTTTTHSPQGEKTAPELTKSVVIKPKYLQQIFELSSKGKGKQLQQYISSLGEQLNIPSSQILINSHDAAQRNIFHFACRSDPNPEEEVDILSLLLTKTKHHDSVEVEVEGTIPDDIINALHQQDKDGLTPLILACQSMHDKTLERIQLIVQIAGSGTTLTCCNNGATSLHHAAGAGASRAVINFLYSHGKSSLNKCTTQGATPLHWACGGGTAKTHDLSKTIRALLDDCGAEVNPIQGEDDIAPLIFALAIGNDKHGKILVQHGADRTVVLGSATCYHIAADLGLKETLQTMLEMDSKVDVGQQGESTVSSTCLEMKNSKGMTPLDQAAHSGHMECVKLLSNQKDDTKARALMEELQGRWGTKINNKEVANETETTNTKLDSSSSQESSIANNNDKGDMTLDEKAKMAATELLQNPPSVSEEDKKNASDAKVKGNSHFAKNQISEAMVAYTEAIKWNPMDATYYSNRSACFMSTKQYEEALVDAITCRILKPGWAKACYRMTVARLALERFEDAAVSAWEGLEIDEKNDELRYLLKKCISKGKKEFHDMTRQMEKNSL